MFKGQKGPSSEVTALGKSTPNVIDKRMSRISKQSADNEMTGGAVYRMEEARMLQVIRGGAKLKKKKGSYENRMFVSCDWASYFCIGGCYQSRNVD